MGLKIETWNIAFRKRENELFNNQTKPFTIIKNGIKGWYADPFLFDYMEETYLFAEFFSYELGRGVISVSKFNRQKERFEDFKVIVSEDYHLSYPTVFILKDKICLMPECSESKSLYIYEAIDFPNTWKKQRAVHREIRLVDSTPFFVGDELFCYTFKLDNDNTGSGELLLMKYENGFFCIKKSLTRDMSLARPGGNIVYEKSVRAVQNCQEEYGKSLSFVCVDNFSRISNQQKVSEWVPENVALLRGKRPCGIHTYNCSRDFEVIDLKYYRNSLYRVLMKIFKH